MRYLILDLETCAIDGAADFIEKPAAPGNYKKPETIAEWEKTEQPKAHQALIDRAALDLDLARIAVFGWWAPADGNLCTALVCQNEEQERHALRVFLDELSINGYDTRIITFNGFKYDLPLIARRAQYLGLPPWRPNLDRYRSQHVDLWNLLSNNGATPAHSLSWYIKRLGWTDLQDSTKGKDIPDLIRAGDWAAVEAHCLNDLKATHRLARWCGVDVPALEEAVV